MKRLFFALAICFLFSPLVFSDDSLTAIDILLEPDDTMLVQAKSDNTRLLENYPEGFALDLTHKPHISVLQCYIQTKNLDKVVIALKRVTDAQKPIGRELKTTGYFYIPWQGQKLAGITIIPTSELLKYQQAIIASIAPFTVKNGTVAAFVPNEDGTQVGETTVAYVDTFIPQHVGKNYNPHVTIGLGREDFLKEMTTAPYTPFLFRIKNVGIYRLGDFGTAKKQLWTSAS